MNSGKRRGRGNSSGYRPGPGQPTAARGDRILGPINDLRMSEMLERLGALDRVNPNIWEPFAADYARAGSEEFEELLEVLQAAHSLAETHYLRSIEPNRTEVHRKLRKAATQSRDLLTTLMPDDAFPPSRHEINKGVAAPQDVLALVPTRRIDPAQQGMIFNFLDPDMREALEKAASMAPMDHGGAPPVSLLDALRYLTALNSWLAWAAHRTPPLTPKERGQLKRKQVIVFLKELDRSTRELAWLNKGRPRFSTNKETLSGWRFEFLRAAEAHGVENGLLVDPPIKLGTTNLVPDDTLRKILSARRDGES